MGCVTTGLEPGIHFMGRVRDNKDREKFLHQNRKQVPILIAGLALLMSFATPCLVKAQVAGGAITGTVTGQSGAVMPDVQISIKDVSSGLARTATTNTNGLYTVPALSVGNYEMTVSAPGYITQVWTDISVAAGVARVINVVINTGDPRQTVRVAAPSALVSEPCPSVCGSANASTVRDTPLNGRDWAALATLQAGVTGVQSSGGNTERGFGAAISISGARPDQNGFQLDGISINDYSNGAPGSVLGDNLGIDAVEQVSVLGNNYPAAYGRTSGGIINAVTRSGKNTFHGTVYEFLRNSALDARNFFDGPVIPPFKRNQFGASAGGPIQKDRTFVFGDYEGLRQSLGVTTVDTVPSAPARNGQLSTGTVIVDPSVSRFLAAFYPLPNGPLLGSGDTGIFSFAGQDVTSENYFTVRVDRKLSDRDNLFGTYMRDNSRTVQPGTFDELLTNVFSARQVISVHEQHLFSPAFVNSVRIGYSRARASTGGVTAVSNPLMLDPSYAFQPGAFAGQIQNVPGLTNFSGAPSAQGLLPSSQTLTWNSYQAGDDVSLTKGRHELKFGGLVERMQDNQLILGSVNGAFRFASLSNFLTNVPQSFQGNQTVAPPEFGLRQTLAGAYFEDDVRLRSTLTIDLGLRYEMATVLSEAHNRLSNLRNLTDAQPNIGSPFYVNPTLRNFEPRVGVAWNPGGGRTLVRGGFGMFDVLPLPYVFSISVQHGVPFVQEVFGNTIPPGSFPTGAFNLLTGSPGSSRSVYVEHAPKRNYVMQWNFSIARELSSTLAVTVGYVGSRGVHQPYKMDNMDMVLPALTPSGYVWPCGPDGIGNPCAPGFLPGGTQSNPAPSVRLNPNFGRISGSLWQANSFYDALQADLTKRVSHGFEFHGAYTWGKSIDTLSATAADDSFPNGLFNQLFFDQRTTRGLSDFNVAQTFVLSLTWELPSPTSGTSTRYAGAATPLRLMKVPAWAASGWQLGALYKLASGQPFTPLVGGDPVGMKLEETGEPPDRVVGPGCETLTNPGNPNAFIKTQCLKFPGPTTRRGNLGRNTLIGPGLSKLDLSVFKNNRIVRKGGSVPACGGAGCKNGLFSNLFSESFNVQFRAEFFNILNQANFSSPTDNLQVFDKSGQPISGAGLITSTQTTSRQIQFAIKVIW
ncbi:MAG: carboxypeptidase regulatory-like domain-containing protein [Acidobacteriia bacterium]|nr:carboxypeptidase regulatory-like domain-containing protein [Terriglobia bacterium]